jgi:hypothetical protein
MSARSDEIALSTSIRRRPFLANSFSAGLHERALARAARAGEQHVVGGPPGHELLGVLAQALLLVVDVLEIRERDGMRMLQRGPGSRGRCACASGTRWPPSSPERPAGRQDALEAVDKGLELDGETSQSGAHLSVKCSSQ